MKQSKAFFAGGKKGPNARSDGNGFLMPRGWYLRNHLGALFGPFDTLTAAKQHPQGGPNIAVEPKQKGYT